MKRYQSSYKPRSIRRLESKTQNRLYITIIAIAMGGLFLVIWGLPAFIGFLTDFNNLKTDTPKSDNSIETAAISPPVLNIPFDATNSATINFNGYTTPKTEVEIFVDDTQKGSVKASDNGEFTFANITLSLGTNNIYAITIDKGQKSLPSKTIKIIYNNEKPILEVDTPGDNLEIKGGDKKIKVSGKTDSQNSVMVNGSSVILTNDGKFLTEIELIEGENTIKISASNKFGNSTTMERKVKYSPS